MLTKNERLHQQCGAQNLYDRHYNHHSCETVLISKYHITVQINFKQLSLSFINFRPLYIYCVLSFCIQTLCCTALLYIISIRFVEQLYVQKVLMDYFNILTVIFIYSVRLAQMYPLIKLLIYITRNASKTADVSFP